MVSKYLMLSSIFLAIPVPVSADIYKCEIEGKLVMQDIPCPEGVDQSTVKVVIQNDTSKKYKPYQPAPYDPSEFSDFENQLIKSHKVEVGMSVKALEFSWGTVRRINRSAYGPEQWVFQKGIYQRYAYVKDGIVVNWQD
ncbi:hypothetical protein [Shewanella sp. Arc9-LZ]|jgi:hypothetical protein|uniref:hypothetical protein n=1 Tax=Shewanella sp. Arc9-LZ TaxID=2698686 RepID=UPI00137BE981|nr:hypothetical protein [Shewanella sp. Arc9-LZ]QHS13166.1 hypothetical protein GUY17_08595 [Shewanella sp. Arc9-LZ]